MEARGRFSNNLEEPYKTNPDHHRDLPRRAQQPSRSGALFHTEGATNYILYEFGAVPQDLDLRRSGWRGIEIAKTVR